MTLVLDTLWPERETRSVPVALIGASLTIGLLAALTVDLEAFGLALAVVGWAVLGTALWFAPARPTTEQLVAAGTAAALMAVVALRSAAWLDALCVLGAVGLGTVTVVRGTTWTGVTLGALAPLAVLPLTPSWLKRAVSGRRLALGTTRGALVAVLTLLLVLVFGSLFAAADPAFSSLVGDLLPSADLPLVVQRAFVLALAAAAALVASCLAMFPPAVDELAPPAAQPVRRWEWVVPLAALDAVFVTFVVVQLAVLFGGRRHVLETQGLSYADYARQGFWQLLTVTVLTLAVVAAATRWAPRATARDRLVVRVLLGVLCVTALVIVASALHRMSLYEKEYGFTRLRLLVQVVEVALGAVYVLLLAAGVALHAAWLPRGVVGLAAASLLVLAALNPDAYVARHNVDRFLQTGKLDVAYLSTLSADAVPELQRLPGARRTCALAPIASGLRDVQDHWYDGNLARTRARHLLGGQLSVCR
ncbi:MAG: DUF4173 domain-containing protein [Actinomycetota bacterium]|nr:DUF4173 domain-containing protein [Actinomycetota bacterium]